MSFCSSEDETVLTEKRITISAEEESEDSELAEPIKALKAAHVNSIFVDSTTIHSHGFKPTKYTRVEEVRNAVR
jgi:hypothetical protein